MGEDNRQILVTIRCITYNHEPFIRQCLEGFVMQKTNFRFEAIVHDDASTDETASILKEYAAKYPDIIIPIYETENQYSKIDGSIDRIMEAHTHGKYVALCEGDDYWTDPLKLQKQVDMLESDPSRVLCFSDVVNYHEASKEFGDRQSVIYGSSNNNMPIEPQRLFYWILFGKCRIQTLSVVYRNMGNLLANDSTFMMGDTPLWFRLSQLGSFCYLPECTGVYRIHGESATNNVSTLSRFHISMAEMRIYYCDLLGYRIPSITKQSYNKAICRYEASSDKRLEAKYPLFHMNGLQRRVFQRCKSSESLLKLVERIWFVEDKIYNFRLHHNWYSELK